MKENEKYEISSHSHMRLVSWITSPLHFFPPNKIRTFAIRLSAKKNEKENGKENEKENFLPVTKTGYTLC